MSTLHRIRAWLCGARLLQNWCGFCWKRHGSSKGRSAKTKQSPTALRAGPGALRSHLGVRAGAVPDPPAHREAEARPGARLGGTGAAAGRVHPRCDAPCLPSSPGRLAPGWVNIWQRFLMALPVHSELWQCPRQPRSRHPREAGGQAVVIVLAGQAPHTPDVTNVSSVPQLCFLSLSPEHST